MSETIVTITALLSLCLLALAIIKWRGAKPVARHKRESVAELEEVLRAAELGNASFFQSLELVQKNLEALLARAESAEQRLRSLMLQPGGDKQEQYAAAALLLGDGQEPQRVATMLNLPLPQVQIVRELQKMTIKEKKNPARKSSHDESSAKSEPPAKAAAQREKNAADPLRLVDVIRKAASEAAKQESQAQRFNGVHV